MSFILISLLPKSSKSFMNIVSTKHSMHWEETGSCSLTCVADPRGRLILRERNKTILVPVVNIHISLSPMHNLLSRRLHIPLSQFTLSHKPIRRRYIKLRKQRYQPAKTATQSNPQLVKRYNPIKVRIFKIKVCIFKIKVCIFLKKKNKRSGI